MHSGWYQVGFERELVSGLNEARVGQTAIALVSEGGAVRAFDAQCPHRGANLCRGGKLQGDFVRCPFHGLAIALRENGHGLRARALRCLTVGGLVFVREAIGRDFGLPERLMQLDATHYVVPGFEMEIAAPAELVIENAFDALHFNVVHAIGNQPEFKAIESDAYAVEGLFRLPPSPWQGERSVRAEYRATAYSPTLVISDLGGTRPYSMITASVPTSERSCIVRLSLAVPSGPGGAAPDAKLCRYLLDGARRGLCEDLVIWEAMTDAPPFNPVPGDEAVSGFRAFCRELR